MATARATHETAQARENRAGLGSFSACRVTWPPWPDRSDALTLELASAGRMKADVHPSAWAGAALCRPSSRAAPSG